MTQAQRLPLALDAHRDAARTGQVLAFPNKLKILHVTFSTSIGGSERYCIDLARRQAAMGHEVHVAGAPNGGVRRCLGEGVTFHPIGLPMLRPAMLSRLAAKLNIDVAHGHLGQACKALSRASVEAPKVATLHVGYKDHHHGRLDGVICVNSAQADRLGGYDGEARVISNWVREEPPQPRGMDLRTELGLAPHTLVVGGVGRLHPSKGNDVLISAFRATAPADAALVIIGEGSQRKQLEKLCEGDRRIFMPGFRHDVDGFLADIDLFVSPSREESFGLAILEAMSAGLPVISTETEGPAQYLRDQPIAMIPPGSIPALAAAMGDFFNAPSRRAQYDLSAFAPAKGVTEILDFYRHLTFAA